MAIVSGYDAVNVIVSALNDRSVVIGTESSPTSSPLTYSENQLSAHTSAVKVELTPSGAAVSVVSIVTSLESVIVVGDGDVGDEDDDEERNQDGSASEAEENGDGGNDDA